jgi:hypothetical protein
LTDGIAKLAPTQSANTKRSESNTGLKVRVGIFAMCNNNGVCFKMFLSADFAQKVKALTYSLAALGGVRGIAATICVDLIVYVPASAVL